MEGFVLLSIYNSNHLTPQIHAYSSLPPPLHGHMKRVPGRLDTRHILNDNIVPIGCDEAFAVKRPVHLPNDFPGHFSAPVEVKSGSFQDISILEGGGVNWKKLMKQKKKPKSTLLADNTRGLITTKQTLHLLREDGNQDAPDIWS